MFQFARRRTRKPAVPPARKPTSHRKPALPEQFIPAAQAEIPVDARIPGMAQRPATVRSPRPDYTDPSSLVSTTPLTARDGHTAVFSRVAAAAAPAPQSCTTDTVTLSTVVGWCTDFMGEKPIPAGESSYPNLWGVQASNALRHITAPTDPWFRADASSRQSSLAEFNGSRYEAKLERFNAHLGVLPKRGTWPISAHSTVGRLHFSDDTAIQNWEISA